MEGMKISNQNAAHIQAYIEYNNIVGNADGGKLFTPEQYEEYKNDLRKNAKNRVYTSWRNAKGMDCKMIGPASMCLCGHRYRDHNYVNPVNKKVHCKASKCTCPCFYSVPVHGSQDFKCLCKGSYTDHDPVTKKCPKGKTGSSTGKFSSTWSCSCQQKFNDHTTVFETREERIALGKPVDDMNRMMGELGALTGGGLSNFSSLVDGAEGYAHQIDALGSLEYQQNKALGYNQQHALGYGDEQESGRSGKLSALNQRISQERGGNALSVQQRSMQGVGGVEGGVSALDLFNTPHNFARAKISIKKPLKY